MSINTNIYGQRASWDYTANTGNTGDADTSTYILHNSLFSYAKTPSGQPIDKSLACSALGTESCWSHLKFYDTSNLGTIAAGGGGFASPDIKENRLLTNWCFSSSLGTFSGSTPTQQFAVIVDGNSIPAGAATNPENSRFSPSPVVSTYNLRYNPSDIKPVTQFCHKNIIACLYVRAFDSPFNDYITADLNTYINNYSSSYPRIRSVYVKLFTDYGQTTRSTIQGLDYLNVSILDNIQLPVTHPYMYGLVTEDDSNGVKIKIMGSICNAGGYFDTKGSTDSSIKTYIGLCAPDTWNVRVDGGDEPTKTWGAMYRDYDETFKDECFTQIACFGLLFTDRESVALTGLITDDNMHCGILDENLIGHGFWTTGAENTDNEQIKWDNSNDSTYDGNNPPEIDDNIYGTSDSFNPVSLADGTLKRYVLDDAGMTLLNQYLWDVIDTSDPDAYIQNQTLTNFLTNNPLDCIVNIKRFPFSDMSQGATTNIKLGKVTIANTAARPFDADSVTLSCGDVKIYHPFNDWRDYICKYTLVLPFCGTVDLPAEIVTGRHVGVNYTIDYTTGTCTAFILVTDDEGGTIAIDSASGNCSIDIPVSGVQTATLNSQIYNANENLKAAKFNNMINGVQSSITTAKTAASGDKVATFQAALSFGQQMVNSIHDVQTAEWNINNTEIPTKMIGASSGCNALQFNLTPRIICYLPITDTAYNAEVYAHTVGFACCENGLLSDYSGYVEATGVDLSGFAATATEKDMIQNLLSGGVIL